MARLGDVVKIEASAKSAEGDKFWLLNLDMVEQQTGRVIAYNYVGQDALNGSIIQFDTNCVLYSKLRPNLNKVVLPREDGFATSEMLPLRPDTRVLAKEYLTAFLRSESFVTWAVSKTAGAKMPRLGTKELLSKEIPLPSLSEQERIAQRFAKIDELIALRKEQLAKLDQLVKSRFIELFGDLASPECKWQKEKLIDACVDSDDIKCGPFGTQLSKDEYQSDGVAVWEIPQINSRFSTIPTHYLSENKAKQLEAYSIKAGDIAMSRKGNVGKCAVFPSNFEMGIIHSDVLRIRVDSKRVLPVFMMHQLHYSGAVQHQIELVSSGAIMAGINVTKLKQILVHIPPLSLQTQFAAFVEQNDKSKLAIQQSLDKLELLKKSLMQEYFG